MHEMLIFLFFFISNSNSWIIYVDTTSHFRGQKNNIYFLGLSFIYLLKFLEKHTETAAVMFLWLCGVKEANKHTINTSFFI